MGFSDFLVVTGVFVGFGYLILARIHQRSPETLEKLKGFFKSKQDDLGKMTEGREQVYPTKSEVL